MPVLDAYDNLNAITQYRYLKLAICIKQHILYFIYSNSVTSDNLQSFISDCINFFTELPICQQGLPSEEPAALTDEQCLYGYIVHP